MVRSGDKKNRRFTIIIISSHLHHSLQHWHQSCTSTNRSYRQRDLYQYNSHQQYHHDQNYRDEHVNYQWNE